MSAFFVGEDHINAMLTFAERCASFGVPTPLRGRAHPVTERDLTEIGQALVAENVKSLRARYPGDYREMMPDDWQGAESYRYRPDLAFMTRTPNLALAVIKLSQCYDYQACEHDSWADSWAASFTRWLRDCAISKIPGYDAAPWGYTRPDDAPTIVRVA